MYKELIKLNLKHIAFGILIIVLLVNFTFKSNCEETTYSVPKGGVHEEKIHKIFPCDTKPGASYCELLFNYTAVRINGENRIYITEYTYDGDCKCKDFFLERMLNTVLGSKDVQKEFQILDAGKYENIEYIISDNLKSEKIEKPARFDCKDCIRVSGQENSPYTIEKYSVVFINSCSTEEKILEVRKITKINDTENSKTNKK